MMNIYFDDYVQPKLCVHTCSTLAEAKNWIRKQLRGYTIVDENHSCTKADYQSSKTAIYQVFDGEPITLDDDGEPYFVEPIYESDYFYTK